MPSKVSTKSDEDHVLAFDVSELAQLLPKGRPPRKALPGVEQADDGRFGGALSACVERPAQPDTQARDGENYVSPLHSVLAPVTDAGAGKSTPDPLQEEPAQYRKNSAI